MTHSGPARSRASRSLGARRSGRYIANAAAFVGGIVLAIVLLEFAVRWIEPQPAYQYRFSPTTVYEPIPNARFVHERDEFSIPITYNSHGMRDAPRALEKPQGTLRIALAGDSFAEAKEVPFDSTIARRLERHLTNTLRGRSIEVLNFGVAGFGTVASTIRFETLGARFAPDLVVYLFVHNDPSDNVGRDARLYTVAGADMEFRSHHPDRAKRAARAMIDWVKQQMHGYRFVRFRIDRALAARAARARPAHGGPTEEGPQPTVDEQRAGIAPTAPDEPSERAWAVTRLAVGRLRDSVRAAGATLVVAQATTTSASMSSRIAAICGQLEVPFVDLVPALEAAPGPVTFETDGHWNSRGHDVAAAALARELARLMRTGRETAP